MSDEFVDQIDDQTIRELLSATDVGKGRAILKRILGALSEPVAWRWRFEDKKTWQYARRRPPYADDRDIVCEPLYRTEKGGF